MTGLWLAIALSLSVELPKSFWPVISQSVAMAAQANKVVVAIGLDNRRGVAKRLNVMDVKTCAAKRTAVRAEPVLLIDNVQSQCAPTGTSILPIATSPIRRGWACLGLFVGDVTFNGTKPWRVTAMNSATPNLIRLQAELFAALLTSQIDTLNPISVESAARAFVSKPATIGDWVLSVGCFTTNGRTTEARTRTILCALSHASFNEHRGTTTSTCFLNARIAHLSIIPTPRSVL